MAEIKRYDFESGKEYRSYGYLGTFGRASVKLTCPFCNTDFRAFVWSLSGSGKKCPKCGAMHTSMGKAYPMLPKPIKNNKNG